MLRWITPAWAGKSITLPFQFIWQKDHPRVGGEKGAVHLHYLCFLKPSRNYLRGFLMAACAAARRAMGTRKGEQLT